MIKLEQLKREHQAMRMERYHADKRLIEKEKRLNERMLHLMRKHFIGMKL